MLARLSAKSSQKSRRDVVAAFTRVYGACLACGGTTADHDVWQLASARPGDPESGVTALKEAISRRDWVSAAQIQEFRGTEDAIVYSFLRCPHRDSIVLVLLESFFDMWLDDRVAQRWVLEGEDLQRARQLVGDAWKRVEDLGTRPDV